MRVRLALSFCLLAAVAGAQQDVRRAFGAGAIEVDGQRYPYRLLEPPVVLRDVDRPLVVFLHGAGERGDDNLRHLEYLPSLLAADVARYPCYLLAVQCPQNEQWVAADWGSASPPALADQPTRALRAVMTVVESLRRRPGVDAARVYVTGLSMGGFAAWELALRRPEWFAAVLPICGGGDPRFAHRLLGMPIAVWHGGIDHVVPVETSRAMVTALRQLGQAVDYREPATVGHDVWNVAYRDPATLAWLFAQDQRQARRGAFALPALIPAPEVVTPPAAGTAAFRLRPGARCHAPEAARAVAQVLCDTIERGLRVRADLIGLGVEAAGDLAFAIDPALRAEFAIDVGPVLRITVREPALLHAAAAAAWQVLQTDPAGSCPAGRLVRTQPVVAGRLVLGASPVPWPEPALLAALRTCWTYDVRELRGSGLDRLDWLPDKARLAVRAAAQRCDIRLLGTDIVDASAGTVRVFAADLAADGIGRLLAAKDATAAGPGAFELHLPPNGPDASTAALELLLPAAAERAHAPARELHVADFLGRLGCQLRIVRG